MASCTDKAPAELRSFLSSVIPFQFHEYSNNGLWMLIVFIIAYSLVLMKGEPLFFYFIIIIDCHCERSSTIFSHGLQHPEIQ